MARTRISKDTNEQARAVARAAVEAATNGCADALNAASLKISGAQSIIELLYEAAASGSEELFEQLGSKSLAGTLHVVSGLLSDAHDKVQAGFPSRNAGLEVAHGK